MRVVENENTKPFDVDDTLVMNVDPNDPDKGRTVQILDPVTRKFLKMRVHEPNVRLLEEEKHRGAYVIVWSRGGYEWAASVVLALGLQDKVDEVMSKPMVYFDDKPVDDWMKYRVYLDPDTRYKK